MSTRTTPNNVWNDLAQKAYAEVEQRFPVAEAERTRTTPDGRVVNMDREAMFARLDTFADAIRDKLCDG